MTVVTLDQKGRISIPIELRKEVAKVIFIPAGAFYILFPIPKDPLKVLRNSLKTEMPVKELKRLAEEKAKEEAVKRAKRRVQL